MPKPEGSVKKQASSQAAWALITGGVADARVEAHRLRHLITRASKLVEGSDHKEHLYQVAGDIIVALPTRLTNLEMMLDKTALALSKMGETFLEARLPLSEKTEVEEAVEPSSGGGFNRFSDQVNRVAQQWLQRNAAAKLPPAIKTQFAMRAKHVGLDGNGRFRSIGMSLNALAKIMEDFVVKGETMSLELEDIMSADHFRGESGHRTFRLAFSNPADSFSPIPIGNSSLVFTWTLLSPDKYEVVAYLS